MRWKFPMYKIGDIVKGKVTGIENYGIFVSLDEYYSGSEESIWGDILKEMFNRRIRPFTWVICDRDKERIRLGSRIKELRKERGMDAKELAQKIGIDAANLSRIEQGRFSVGIDILNKIAGVMNMSLDFVPNCKEKL